jgi:beta-mannosidase
MFHEHRVDVTDDIEHENILSLIFYSALRKGREQVDKRGDLKFWNGEASRLYVRKAQYHWGWDWGTKLSFHNTPPPL